ncbi:hypothetical protein V6N12_044555 [Hibiscus sabdariffa]|uniref:DNA-directed RNA polymerase subunit n=1 Tax=Hibiscus sabdariffa TaxID=183260 RepID=A0ABR2AJ64_9ROSI
MIDRYKHQQLRIGSVSPQQISAWAKKILPNGETVGEGFDTFRNREISTGAGAIREQLADLDLRILIDYSVVEWKELGEEGLTGNEWEDRKIGRRKDFLVRRMELAKHFIRTNIEPEWMVLCLLPVLPPELRPIIQIDGGKLMSSDINELYRRVIYRNNTLTDLLTTSRSTPGELVMCQEKLVQEAVDTLLDNGIRGQPMRDGHNKVYKSFSDVIEGKEGRFRETLLGKRVDYSGRSVIVVGPSLSLHRCGLPREIAIELFQTFVIRGLIRQHLAPNIGVAKSKIREKGPIIWEILQEVMRGHPVLLNRAPTLHRLDFDGDQMAVHVPLSLEAQAEARLLMFSHMNLLSPAIGDPISVPTQDMLIGLYVLTSGNRRGICANRQKRINLDSPLWLRWRLDQCVIASREAPIEVHYESLERANLVFHNKVIDGTAIKRLISRLIDHFGMAYTSHILDQVKTLGFQQATATSISLGIDDLLTIPSKGWLVQDAEQQSLILEKHHHFGNVHAVEKLRQSIEIWYATSEYLRQEMNPNFRMTDPFNPVHIMSFSGARGNASQVHQLVGMRGLMSDPQGQMIDLPIQSNLREGLSLTEYIISCYGARKGVVDTAVRTSDAGYLTRRLVEVVQHIVVRRTDCGTTRGISVSPQKRTLPERIFIQTLIGRVLADDIYMGTRCIAIRNQDIGLGLVDRFRAFRTQPISIRTPFTCRSTSWICRLCYGRSATHGDLVELGEAVGIIAGQSIGEPGTQLTLRTFHTGGVFTGGTEHCDFIYSAILHENADLLAKRRRNRFIIPFQLIQDQEKEKELMLHSHSGISMEIPINGIFRRKSILAFFDDPRYRRKGSGITKYGTIGAHSIVKKEDVIEYRGVKKVKPKYQMKVDRFFFIPEEVHILSESSSIMVRNNSIIGVDTQITLNTRSQAGGLVRVERKKKRIELRIFSGNIYFPGERDKISRHSGILIPPGTGKTNSKESKKLKNWIYVQRITPTKKKYFVLVRPVTPYEISDGINLATLFPQDPFREKDNMQLRVVNYILYGNGKPTRRISDTSIQLVRTCLVLNWDQDNKSSSAEEVCASFVEVRTNVIRSAKPYLATPGATVHGHYGEILYQGDTLVTFIYEKSRSGDITQGLPKVEQVLEVRSIDSISMNLEKRVEGWNEYITRILGIPWGFVIGAELTIVQSRLSLVNKIQKVYRSQGVQIHNRHIEIIVRQITSKVLVSEDGMSNVFLPGELIGLLRAERTGRALEEAIWYRVVLLGITRASLNTQSFISEASFQETARVLAKAALRGRIDWLKGLKENVVLGGMIPAGTGFKGLVHRSRQHNNILLETKKKNFFGEEMRDIFFHHRELFDSCISNNLHDTSGYSFIGIEFNDS